jgi:DNA-binding transcriptional LysR family regulator
MNLRFLEAFVWVARFGSFKAAADRLHTTQTAISARIATLEEQFGVRLFERDKRHVALTHSGRDLLGYAEEILAVSARMMDAVADRASHRGTVVVGAIETVVHTWLPELLRRFGERFPQATIELRSNSTQALHEELLRGHLDLVFTADELPESAIENQHVCTFSVDWVAGSALAGAHDDDVLDRQPVLTFLPGSFIHRDAVAKLETRPAARINPISALAAMVALLRSGYGVATLPHAAIQREVQAGDLILLHLEPPLDPMPVFASLRAHSDSPLVPALVSLSQEAVRAFAARSPPGTLIVAG